MGVLECCKKKAQISEIIHEFSKVTYLSALNSSNIIIYNIQLLYSMMN